MDLLDDFVEDCFWIVTLFSDKNIGHTLCDELKRFHIVFILVEVGDVVLEIDFWLSSVLLYLFEEKVNVLVGAFFDLSSDVDAGYIGPRDEEIAEELFEYVFSNYRLSWRYNHFERDSSL